MPDGLTIAVTGPTGEIGKPFLAALERVPEVERVIGMARRPFDIAAHGWEKVEYRRGDVLDRDSVEACRSNLKFNHHDNSSKYEHHVCSLAHPWDSELK